MALDESQLTAKAATSPAARSSRGPTAGAPQPPNARRASPPFSQQILQRHVVQQRVGPKPLQRAVLLLQRFQLARFGDVHPAELRLSFIEGRRADAVPAAQLLHRDPGLLLPQDPEDLLLAEPRLLHPSGKREVMAQSARRRQGPRSRRLGSRAGA